MSIPYYSPFIEAPPLTSCQSAYLVFGQGTPPYTIFPIASGSANATSLESLPLQSNAGFYKWNCDFDTGANITWTLIDAKGQQAYSVFRVVQTGAVSTCPKNKPVSNTHSSPAGAIAGGVIGGIVLLCLLLAAFLIIRKRRRTRASGGLIHSHRPSSPSSQTTTEIGGGGRGATGVARAGTFNLHNVEFTEPSLDHLRSLDAPPQYVPGSPKRFGIGRNRNRSSHQAARGTDSGTATPTSEVMGRDDSATGLSAMGHQDETEEPGATSSTSAAAAA